MSAASTTSLGARPFPVASNSAYRIARLEPEVAQLRSQLESLGRIIESTNATIANLMASRGGAGEYELNCFKCQKWVNFNQNGVEISKLNRELIIKCSNCQSKYLTKEYEGVGSEPKLKRYRVKQPNPQIPTPLDLTPSPRPQTASGLQLLAKLESEESQLRSKIKAALQQLEIGSNLAKTLSENKPLSNYKFDCKTCKKGVYFNHDHAMIEWNRSKELSIICPCCTQKTFTGILDANLLFNDDDKSPATCLEKFRVTQVKQVSRDLQADTQVEGQLNMTPEITPGGAKMQSIQAAASSSYQEQQNRDYLPGTVVASTFTTQSSSSSSFAASY